MSDLDLLVVLSGAPADADRAAARAIEAALDEAYAQINGAGVVLGSAAQLSELERYDGGFFVACLCTPLLGEDLAAQLPRYRPTGLLARETNGDLALVLPRWHTRAAEAGTDADRRTLSRAIARRLVRTGFTLIMPRWGGWTSDLERSAELFAATTPAARRADAPRRGRRPNPLGRSRCPRHAHRRPRPLARRRIHRRPRREGPAPLIGAGSAVIPRSFGKEIHLVRTDRAYGPDWSALDRVAAQHLRFRGARPPARA